jgi:glutamate-5-semialdehyde dehydrogenase
MATPSTTASSTHQKLLHARAWSEELHWLPTVQKNAFLLGIARAVEEEESTILAANKRDLDQSNLEGAMRDRLLLTSERIREMARTVREVAALPDPIGEILAEWQRPNGLRIRKVRVPLGVIGIIYESRPNATVDAAALAFKTGNGVVLRGGQEAWNTNQCLVEIICSELGPLHRVVALLDSSSRESVHELIKARGLVDVIIPRGGPELIKFVAENSVVPVIETGAGNCHIFIDESADFDMADRIVLNAKTQRPSVCNAVEKLLVHAAIAADYISGIIQKLIAAGVEVRGDGKTCALAAGLSVTPATDQDWDEEYLRLCMAIAVVPDLDAAIAHINKHSTKHSEAIITRDETHALRFLREVDSAAVYWNASTRFTDGGEFGFGAEMGISTQKLHCRGPFALTELTSSKYEIIGTGQTRP